MTSQKQPSYQFRRPGIARQSTPLKAGCPLFAVVLAPPQWLLPQVRLAFPLELPARCSEQFQPVVPLPESLVVRPVPALLPVREARLPPHSALPIPSLTSL